ncbi:hypothetical protein [Xanthomonas sp. CFBP 8445]|nr:hypothetical protein [Xanthomonas sp. CFBP 8445]UYC12097.1 hypothetical protein NUG21_20555 [Xanthomonas sp. CFBP 8445]
MVSSRASADLPRPRSMFLHAGLPPRNGDKYILSTYLEFTAKPA